MGTHDIPRNTRTTRKDEGKTSQSTGLVHAEESYRIRGAIFEVYREMGCGFLESVYQECLAREMTRQQIPFASQEDVTLYYKGERLDQRYKPDFVCFGQVIVEIKAVSELHDEHRAQLHNYLVATGLSLGILANFGHYPKAEIERIVR